MLRHICASMLFLALVLPAAEASPRLKLAQSGTICPTDYKPVCGTKDGKKQTFSNRCVAEREGATAIVDGACEAAK